MAENRTVDATKHHLESADDPSSPGWHIAIFLLWAARRGLAASRHEVAQIEPDPMGYFSTRLGGVLWTSDLTEPGADFALAHYDDYLGELDDIADANDLTYVCDLADRPDGAQWALEVLDELHELWAGG